MLWPAAPGTEFRIRPEGWGGNTAHDEEMVIPCGPGQEAGGVDPPAAGIGSMLAESAGGNSGR